MITPNATRNCPQMSNVTCGKYVEREGAFAELIRVSIQECVKSMRR
jgi:hypothetical protein